MDMNLVIIDISSDDEEVGCDKTDSGCDSYGWSSAFLDQGVDDYDQVGVIGEVKPKKRGNYLDDECVILDGDPDKLMAEVIDSPPGGADELLIVGQKGQIACRDYPHPRSICAMFPFGSTPHERHCDMCHCYVCESPAPCAHWGTGISSADHCHATDMEAWKLLRSDFQGGEDPEFVSRLTTVRACSISTNPEIQRFRSQCLFQCRPGYSVSNLGPRSCSFHRKFKRAGSVGSSSARQSNGKATHGSQYLRRHHPVSRLSHRDHANRLPFHHPDTDSESATCQTNLDYLSRGHRGCRRRLSRAGDGF